MITAPMIEPPAIIEEVRWRKRQRIMIKKVAPKATPAPVARDPPVEDRCTEASPEFCGGEVPIVIVPVCVTTGEPRGTQCATFDERFPPYKGDRLK